MQELTFSLPFNLDVYRSNQKLKWQIFLKKKYSTYLYFYGTISVILLIILINLLLGNGKPYSPAFFGVTLFLLIFNILTPWTGLYKSRKKFFEAVAKNALRYQNEKSSPVYILNDEGISYEDSEILYKMRWPLLQPFYVYKDTIFLTTKDNDTLFLMLGKTEVEEALFENIHELLKRNIGFRAKF